MPPSRDQIVPKSPELILHGKQLRVKRSEERVGETFAPSSAPRYILQQHIVTSSLCSTVAIVRALYEAVSSPPILYSSVTPIP